MKVNVVSSRVIRIEGSNALKMIVYNNPTLYYSFGELWGRRIFVHIRKEYYSFSEALGHTQVDAW